MSTVKCTRLHFRNGPWDGATIECSTQGKPPLKLWVYTWNKDFITPRFVDLRAYAALNTSGPYVGGGIKEDSEGTEFTYWWKPW